MHAAISGRHGGGNELLPQDGWRMRSFSDALFALVLQDGFRSKPGRGGEAFRKPDAATAGLLLSGPYRCLGSFGEPGFCSLLDPWPLPA